jgi:hypothetical protein
MADKPDSSEQGTDIFHVCSTASLFEDLKIFFHESHQKDQIFFHMKKHFVVLT